MLLEITAGRWRAADREQCRAGFAGARVARLATISGDGSPRLVPITFVLVGEVVYSAVDHKPKLTTHLVRLQRIAAEPRISLLVDDYSEDWAQLWWVRADARAEVLRTGPEWATGIATLAERYEQYRRRPPEGAVIRAAVERWTGWAAGAVETPRGRPT